MRPNFVSRFLARKPRFGLRSRLLLTILMAASTVGWGTWEIMSHSIRSRFSRLETYHATENACRAKNLIAERAGQLAGHASDWGAWDETYAYIDDLNEEYVKSNLTSDGISRLNINCLLFLDSTGSAKASVGFDFASGEVVNASDSIREYDWTRYSLVEAELNTKHSGVVFIDNSPFLMGASQILTSEGTGPVRGTIIELRRIDERELASLSKSLRFPFSLSTSSRESNEDIFIDLFNDESMAVYFKLNELLGAESVDSICMLDRQIMAEGNQALADTQRIVLLMGGLLSLLLYFVMGRIIIARICKMTCEINSLDDKSAVWKVSDRGGDEIEALAKQFNSLFDSMLASQKELCARNQELATAKSNAESASRSKSAFLANMSHEIRTPLTAILGYTDILREDNPGHMMAERRLETIDTIQRAGLHLLTVINDILDLSKIEADKVVLERIPMSVPGILKEICSLMISRAQEKNIHLCFKLASPIPSLIDGDPTRLRQILMNLVGNAIKFTNVGSVTVLCGLESRDGIDILVFDIEDTGIGLSKSQSAELFQAFSQADETVTRQHGGTGLGLTICRRLANLMGGDVQLKRSEPAVGSSFRLELPIVISNGVQLVHTLTESNTPEAESVPTTTRLEGRILIAEDGPDNQKLISFHLRKAGATVEIAENGLIALQMIERSFACNKPYDLLVTDMQMPVMDGYNLASTLRARRVPLAIIALTAHAMADDRDKCIAAGCDDYASKPIDKASLLSTCEKWIGKGMRIHGAHWTPCVATVVDSSGPYSSLDAITL